MLPVYSVTYLLVAHTHNSRLSVFDGDNVRLNLSVYSPPPKSLGDSFRR